MLPFTEDESSFHVSGRLTVIVYRRATGGNGQSRVVAPEVFVVNLDEVVFVDSLGMPQAAGAHRQRK